MAEHHLEDEDVKVVLHAVVADEGQVHLDWERYALAAEVIKYLIPIIYVSVYTIILNS